jgi:formate dehydrogenase beta subunit
MSNLAVTINGRPIESPNGKTILEVADSAGIYIPRLCHHPDLPPASDVVWSEFVMQGGTKITSELSAEKAGDRGHCNLCLVEIEGRPEPVNSCITQAEDGMVIETETPNVVQLRKKALSRILADHPHACLTCAQKQGCSRTDCSSNVPVDERCCILLGRCQLEKVSDYIGIPGDTPKYVPKNRPVVKDDPLFDRDFNLCISCLRCVRICRDVRGIDALGAVWKDERAWVGTRNGSGLKEADCRFCGACVEVCPTGALLDKEDVAPVRRDSPVPCVGQCPAGIDIPRYVHLIAEGRTKEALEVIRSSVPFPGILGYVCFHPCEEICRRGGIDEPVAICALKRFAADNVPLDDLESVKRKPDTGKRVAVVGSGPAGLTAAYYLSAAGHKVDIFDQSSEPGGMLRYGIPEYRLPSDVLDRELQILKGMDIDLHMDHKIGADFGVQDLKDKGFDSILLAAGTPVSKNLPVENSDLDGILQGLDFLKSAKSDQKPELNGRVVVIGGGNVAIDAAMTAWRLGAQNVQMVCLESRDEMPAHDWEIAQAEEEGVEINPSWGPMLFVSDKGRVSGVKLKRCTRVFDSTGRFDPQYDETETKEIAADYVIITIGQEADAVLVRKLNGLGGNKEWSAGIDGVFAAGDLVKGPSSVVEAISDGRKAAGAIDACLGGTGLPEILTDSIEDDHVRLETSSQSFNLPRRSPESSNPTERKSGFGVIEKTFQNQVAIAEAGRCLQCHLRVSITPDILPPEPWLPLNRETIDSVPAAEGVFRLLDEQKQVIRISGTADLRQGLTESLDDPGQAEYFMWEEDPMYTKRESELIQQYLQQHGKLPPGNDTEDDLF